jgi:uncharacterized membrane protein YeaQ/YmgE (transglycosylase-associated protein family)
MPSLDQVAVWIVVGLIGGALAGVATTWERRGYGLVRNLGLGLAGALVGGFLFRLLDLWPSLERYSLSLRDIVAAFVGSLVVLLVLAIARRYRRAKRPTSASGTS